MDEIKNTAEAEEQKVTVTSAETNTNEEAANTTATSTTTEDNTAEKHSEPTTKAEVIEQLKQIVYNGGNVERTELDHLKMLYYRFHNADVTAARNKFIEEGGKAEDFMPAPDTDEENFKAQLSLIRELRNKAAEELEKEKQNNLKRKQEIIERIKELASSPDEADKGYNEVKELQNEWKEIKQVPAENATELWKNYQLYTEQFYDQLRLNHEMRAYDFKKNLEIKTHLCEAAEKLADLEDPISAFHQLKSCIKNIVKRAPLPKSFAMKYGNALKMPLPSSTSVTKTTLKPSNPRKKKTLKRRPNFAKKLKPLILSH